MQLRPSRLRELRLRRALTQAELAAMAGITESNLNRIESGAQKPRISTVRKLAAALGVDPAELIDWEAMEEDERGKRAA